MPENKTDRSTNTKTDRQRQVKKYPLFENGNLIFKSYNPVWLGTRNRRKEFGPMTRVYFPIYHENGKQHLKKSFKQNLQNSRKNLLHWPTIKEQTWKYTSTYLLLIVHPYGQKLAVNTHSLLKSLHRASKLQASAHLNLSPFHTDSLFWFETIGITHDYSKSGYWIFVSGDRTDVWHILYIHILTTCLPSFLQHAGKSLVCCKSMWQKGQTDHSLLFQNMKISAGDRMPSNRSPF